MNTYFKYTSGESFTLDSRDYYGFFYVDDNNNAYTGKLSSNNTQPLIPKNTLISNFYLNKYEFDNVFTHINDIIPYLSNVYDVLNKQTVDKLIDKVTNNNLKMFGAGVSGNPFLYNFKKNNNYYYGSTDNSETLDVITSILNIVPFSSNPKWNFLENIKTGVVVVNSEEEFKYLCSTGLTNYIIRGSFDSTIPLSIIRQDDLYADETDELDYTHYIYHDVDNKKITYVNNDFINIYDSSNYYDCDNLFLLDKIKLIPTSSLRFIWNKINIKFSDFKELWNSRYTTNNPNNPEYIKFGKSIRTSINENILYIINKYSSDIYQKIDLSILDLGEILDLDVRDVDDVIVILHKKTDGLYVIFLDIENSIYGENIKLNSVRTDMDWYRISFSNIDSNIFHISNSLEYQARYITYPSYPYGRLELGGLLYDTPYKWSEFHELYNASDVMFADDRKFSNSYHNILTSESVKNDKMYMLLHNVGRLYALSQPLPDRYSNNIPLDLIQYFKNVECGDSSIGIYFNTIITSIIKDTLNIFNQSSGSFVFDEYGTTDKILSDFTLRSENLYINGNETFNTLVLQRILLLIAEIQSKVLPTT